MVSERIANPSRLNTCLGSIPGPAVSFSRRTCVSEVRSRAIIVRYIWSDSKYVLKNLSTEVDEYNSFAFTTGEDDVSKTDVFKNVHGICNPYFRGEDRL